MKFKNSTFEDSVLLYSEGEILKIVQQDDPENPQNVTPYLRVICNHGNHYIYVKTNFELMKLYFQGRLTTKELFLTRCDEPYFLQIRGSDKITRHNFSDDFNEIYIETIECGNDIYYALSLHMRIENPFETVLRFWHIFY